MAEETSMKTAEITQAVGVQVMDVLNEGSTIAVMGRNLDDGSYEFLLGPVYLPSEGVSLRASTETRQLFANLRLEDQKRTNPQHVKWMCKRGDEYTQVRQPAQAIVIDSVGVSPDDDVICIYHHNSARG